MNARSVRGRSTAAAPSFEDVLFGTTGLLTVMLVWALTQIGVPDVSQSKLDDLTEALASMTQQRDAAQGQASAERGKRKKAEQDGERERQERRSAEAQAAQANAAREKAEEAAGEAERRAGELEPKPCDVVFCVDAAVLDAVRTTALSLSDVGARLSPRFRVGVVTYSGAGIAEFPLTRINNERLDGEASEGLRALRDHLEALETVGGDADVPGGVSAAKDMLTFASGSSSRQLLVLMGDANCSELDGNETKHVESVWRDITDFGKGQKGQKGRRVLSIFTGNDPSDTAEIEFFKQVAGWAGRSQGTYTNDIADLSGSVIEALFSNLE